MKASFFKISQIPISSFAEVSYYFFLKLDFRLEFDFWPTEKWELMSIHS